MSTTIAGCLFCFGLKITRSFYYKSWHCELPSVTVSYSVLLQVACFSCVTLKTQDWNDRRRRRRKPIISKTRAKKMRHDNCSRPLVDLLTTTSTKSRCYATKANKNPPCFLSVETCQTGAKLCDSNTRATSPF